MQEFVKPTDNFLLVTKTTNLATLPNNWSISKHQASGRLSDRSGTLGSLQLLFLEPFDCSLIKHIALLQDWKFAYVIGWLRAGVLIGLSAWFSWEAFLIYLCGKVPQKLNIFSSVSSIEKARCSVYGCRKKRW